MDDASEDEFAAFARAVGRRVEAERRRLGLTKEELAARSGMSSRYLWRVEAGRQNVTLKTVLALSQALGLTVSDLMSGIEQLASELMTIEGQGSGSTTKAT